MDKARISTEGKKNSTNMDDEVFHAEKDSRIEVQIQSYINKSIANILQKNFSRKTQTKPLKLINKTINASCPVYIPPKFHPTTPKTPF